MPALMALLSASSQAQVLRSIGAIKQGMDVNQLQRAAVDIPSQVIQISIQIQMTFSSSPSRYAGLDNNVAKSAGWLVGGPLTSDRIELESEPMGILHAGAFSIALKKLTHKDCEMLARNSGLETLSTRIDLNGHAIFRSGARLGEAPTCDSEWFFQDGSNDLKFVMN
jgi:hypothetical protein